VAEGIYAALSGALAHQTSLEATATNLANSSTTGYRSIVPVFHEVLARAAGPEEPVHFSAIRSTSVDTSPGAIEKTDRPLDIALGENAFLAVETPAGERYTRAGSLRVAPNGTLVTLQGHPVFSEAEERIEVPANSTVTIEPNGEVKSNGDSVGFLRVVTFDNPKSMTFEGEGLLATTVNTGAPNRSLEEVTVGALEASNASPVRSMTDLMLASRMFEAMTQAIDTINGVDKRLVNSVPKAT
jgi:flagellar basal body rod protein FlgG